MVRGSGRSLSSLLTSTALILIIAACNASDGTVSTRPEATTTLTSPPTTTSTSTTTTTTTLPTTTTTVPPPLPEIDAEVLIPDGGGPFPAVVLVHGGGWIGGSPSIMRPLAEYLTDEGFLTVNTRYALSGQQPGFPAAVEDVACAVRYAAAHTDSDGSVAVLGHSAGAHIAAVVALTGDLYSLTCPIPGTGVPDRLVGLAGPYDITRLGPLMIPFFGVGPTEEPETWVAGNPFRLVAENTDLVSLLMYGDADGFIDDSFTFDFAEALDGAGSEALVEVVEGARHNDMYAPRFVGDLIATWLDG